MVKKKQTNTDKAQSERFKELAKELEADGDLNLTDAEDKFEKMMDKVLPADGKSSTPQDS